MGKLGIFFGEITAFLVALVLIYHLFKWLQFKFRLMVRKDKEDFYYRHGLEDELKDEIR